jgi:pheromone shutdown protein TraB
MITIIGTSHIARQSVEEVRNAIIETKPDIVAIELDYARYRALLSGKKKVKVQDAYSMRSTPPRETLAALEAGAGNST